LQKLFEELVEKYHMDTPDTFGSPKKAAVPLCFCALLEATPFPPRFFCGKESVGKWATRRRGGSTNQIGGDSKILMNGENGKYEGAPKGVRDDLEQKIPFPKV
jgi:hypothetical protein